jgi:hypothetical protein
MVHLLSVPATALACLHAYQLGSDSGTPAFKVLLPVAVGLAIYPLGVRIWSLVLANSEEAPSQR